MKTKTRSARATSKSNAHHTQGLIDAAAEAAMELGAAAESFRESWQHVQKAQKRGKTAAKPLIKTGKEVLRAAKKTTRSAVRKVTGKRSK